MAPGADTAPCPVHCLQRPTPRPRVYLINLPQLELGHFSMKESKDEKKKRLKQICMVHGDICSSQKGDIRNTVGFIKNETLVFVNSSA